MVNLLAPIYEFTGQIVSSAQPKWDGGIMGFFLNHVLFLNKSEQASPANHVIDTIQSGGYLAGLVCGLIWAILLLIVGLGLCICHCRRKSDTKTSMMYVMIAHQIQYKRGRMGQSSLCKAVQFSLSILFTIIAFIMCILAFVVNTHLNTAMTSVRNNDAVIPSIARSVKNVQQYVNLLAPHARIATKPIVDEIVYKTEVLQNDTKAVFTKALTKKIQGDILQDNGIKLVEYMTTIYNSIQQITESQKRIAENPIREKIKRLTKNMRKSCSSLDKLEKNSKKNQRLQSRCSAIYSVLTKNVVFNMTDISISKPKAFVTLLKQFNQTPPVMRSQMDVALMKKKAIEDRLYIKSKKLLKVSETVRNMTNAQWDDLELKLESASAMLENVTDLLYGDMRHQVVKYEGIRNAVYLIVLFIMILMCLICSVVFIYHFSIAGGLTRRLRNGCKIVLYISMMILCIVVVVCTGTFLLGGYSQTEVCRYLSEKPIENRNLSNMHLDKIVNNFINKHWSVIEGLAGDDSSMPVPRPRDVFYGIQTTCRQNKSIMLAINGIESMDMSAVSKPEMTKRFLRLGRKLMHESFRTTNPDDLLRPNMAKEMSDLKMSISKFIYSSKYTGYIDILNKPPLSINLSQLNDSLTNLFLDVLKVENKSPDLHQAYLDLYVAKDALPDLIKVNETYEKEMRIQKMGFTNLRNHMNISVLVDEMLPAIGNLSLYIYNVSHWISTADKLYDEIIVEGTKRKSPKLMAESTEKIMSVLGPCRHIFNAFNIMIFTSCKVIVQSINLLWFFIGCSVVFLTPSIIMALLVLTKEMGLPSSISHLNGSQNPYGDDVKHEKHEMTGAGDVKDSKHSLK